MTSNDESASLRAAEPPRNRPADKEVSRRYSALARRDTTPEITLRRALWHAGLRYRVQYKVPGLPRRKVDIAFTRQKVVVQTVLYPTVTRSGGDGRFLVTRLVMPTPTQNYLHSVGESSVFGSMRTYLPPLSAFVGPPLLHRYLIETFEGRAATGLSAIIVDDGLLLPPTSAIRRQIFRLPSLSPSPERRGFAPCPLAMCPSTVS